MVTEQVCGPWASWLYTLCLLPLWSEAELKSTHPPLERTPSPDAFFLVMIRWGRACEGPLRIPSGSDGLTREG